MEHKEKERKDDSLRLVIDKRRLAGCEFRTDLHFLLTAAAEKEKFDEMLRRCLHACTGKIRFSFNTYADRFLQLFS